MNVNASWNQVHQTDEKWTKEPEKQEYLDYWWKQVPKQKRGGQTQGIGI